MGMLVQSEFERLGWGGPTPQMIHRRAVEKSQTKAYRTREKYQIQGVLVKTLEKIPDPAGRFGYFRHLADRLRNCRGEAFEVECDQGHIWDQASGRCNLRICPWCAHDRAAWAQRRYDPLLEHFRKSSLTRFVTLNETNFPLGQLPQGIDLLPEHYKALCGIEGFESFKDALPILDFTYRREELGSDLAWNVHMHVLVECGQIPQPEGVAAWKEATGGRGQTFYIQYLSGRDPAREIFKYAVLIDKLANDPEGLREFILATENRKLIRPRGDCQNSKKFPKGKMPESELPACPDCGSTVLKVVRRGLRRSDIFVDDAGVLRPRLPAPQCHSP